MGVLRLLWIAIRKWYELFAFGGRGGVNSCFSQFVNGIVGNGFFLMFLLCFGFQESDKVFLVRKCANIGFNEKIITMDLLGRHMLNVVVDLMYLEDSNDFGF